PTVSAASHAPPHVGQAKGAFGNVVMHSLQATSPLLATTNPIPRPLAGRSVTPHLVDRHGQGEQQRLVLTFPDLDAVGLAYPQPLLRHRRDDVPVALDLVLVVEDVALRLEVFAVLDVYVEAVT